jgi:YidC/Oxa1 family membrane protein insertase
MLDILYTIIIYPLVQIIEVFYQVGFKVFEKAGLSIACVSIGVTFLCLPLYIAAEKWQEKERETFRRLKPKIDKIKAVFKGNEQYMILSAYYRQNNYHPLYALRNSFGILIQVPFFVAAYIFLSHLESLKGVSFFFIRDLGAPDGVLSIGGMRLNILPILMTAINCIAGAIYSRNLFARDKIQIYGMAALFLILLYHSPSGLVLYWTLNNVFSLIKNIFMLLKRPLMVLYFILCGFVCAVDIFLIFFHTTDLYKRILLVIISLAIPALPLLIKAYRFMANTILKPLDEDRNKRLRLFIFSQIVCCLLLCFVIPSSVIASSPQEFSFIESVDSPFVFLWNVFFQGIGFLIFWPFCLYFLLGDKIKTALTLFSLFLCFSSILNTFIFPGSYGEFTGMLIFSNDGTLKPTFDIGLINIMALLFACGIIAFLIGKKKFKIMLSTFIILSFAFLSVSFINSVKIASEYKKLTEIRAASGNGSLLEVNPVFHLSKTGINVIVIMLDRGVNIFVPEIFSENPELYSQYSGFTWYPNTISFNSHTLMGAPPLFGGYEYTPLEINKRSSEVLVKKHNESLLLMPLIFSEKNFAVTVTDPPWANYSWIPDIRIYSDYPDIKVENTIRSYTSLWLSRNIFSDLPFKSKILKRNFLWFGIFKSSPLVLRTALYNSGKWWSTDSPNIDLHLILNNYAVMDMLSELTDTNVTKPNTFLLMQNELTHEPAYLQAPDYIPVPEVSNRGPSKYANIINYPTNAAALKRLGTWFEFLKQNGLYDNTRIIITADHGADFDSGLFSPSNHIPFRREWYNPLMLVKDFNADFPLKTDMEFMTNADTPTLAFKDLITNPVNPFTGNPVNDELKQKPLQITISGKWMPYEHYTNTFRIGSNEWYTVHTDIFDADNWEKKEGN